MSSYFARTCFSRLSGDSAPTRTSTRMSNARQKTYHPCVSVAKSNSRSHQTSTERSSYYLRPEADIGADDEIKF